MRKGLLFFALCLAFLLPTHAHAAIAFDSSLAVSSTATTAFTTTGGNLCVVVMLTGDTGSPSDPTVTYAGVSMTLINKIQETSDRWQYLFFLSGATAGANNIVESGAVFHRYQATSYTGCGGVDSNATSNSTNTTYLQTTTVVAASSWLVGGLYGQSTATAVSPGSIRQESDAEALGMADSNGTVGTGSQSLTWTLTAAQQKVGIIISIKPPAVTTAKRAEFGSPF